jgi:hypothetical protein
LTAVTVILFQASLSERYISVVTISFSFEALITLDLVSELRNTELILSERLGAFMAGMGNCGLKKTLGFQGGLSGSQVANLMTVLLEIL